MGVYIRGMEMPTNCAWCRFLQSTGPIPKRELFCGIDTNNNIHDYKPDKGCPLVSIPPHGRLIDADALMENEENISFKDEWHMTVTEAFVSVKNIAHAPTIIEAEEGER